MNNLNEIIVRIKADTLTFDNPLDDVRGEIPQIWRGNDIKFELGVFRGDDLLSVSNYASISLSIRAMTSDGRVPHGSSPALMQKTTTELNTALTSEEWQDGTSSHAVIEFSAAESNIFSGDHWLSIWATTKDAQPKLVTLCAGIIRVLEVGGGSTSIPPDPIDIYYTAERCEEEFLKKSSVSLDGALGMSDDLVPSQKAVKTYVDANTQPSSGEANTASNIGDGAGIFAIKSGTDLRFKSLHAGENVAISSDDTTITISATGTNDTSGGNDGSNNDDLLKRLLNHGILSAPNGVVTVNGSSVTVKRGLKVSFPAGRMEDGNCNSITYELIDDQTFANITVSPADTYRYLFLTYASGVLSIKTCSINAVLFGTIPANIPAEAGNTIHWFDSNDNVWKVSSDGGNSWEQENQIILGRYDCNGSEIVKLSPAQPVSPWSNFNVFDAMKCSLPGDRYIDITAGASGETYVAPANGWISVATTAYTTNNRIILQNIQTMLSNGCGGYSSNNVLAACLPVMAGDVFSLIYAGISSIATFRLIYLEGNLCI